MSDDRIWIWGRHPVLEAVRSGRASSILVAVGRKPAPVLRDIFAVAREHGVTIREASSGELDAIAPGASTQGVAARVRLPRLDDVNEMLAVAAAGSAPPFILVLDQVQDPHNFGALLRSAEAAGVQAVVVPDRRSAALTGTVAKASAGAMSHLPILEVPNLARAVDEIKRAGIWVMGLDATEGAPLFEADLTGPLALAVGGEAEGLRRLTRERCDRLLRLPMRGVIESLNASVAGSIALFEAVRQRGAGGVPEDLSTI